MLDYLSKLLDTSDFPARWNCGHWTAGHGWLHIASDILIWGAYSAIPLVLAYFVWKRKDIPFPNIFWLFVAFIFFCGMTHLVDALIFYWPVYRLGGLLKLCTAVASWMTVLAMVSVVPQALSLPGLAKLNEQLQEEIEQRKRVENQIRSWNQTLEESVTAKVSDLQRSEQLLRLIQRAAMSGAWSVDPRQRHISCSPEFRTLYGIVADRPTLTIEEWLSYVHPEDRNRAYRDLKRALSGAGQYESEFRIVCGDRSVKVLLGQGRLHSERESGLGYPCLLGIHLDITQRKQLEDAIATQVDEEKRRIGAELHDGLGQQITGLGFLAKSLSRSLVQDRSPHAAQAEELSRAIPEIVRGLRDMVRGIMPVEIDSIGLMSALEQLAEATTARFQVACWLDCDGNVEVTEPQAAQQLYRIGQEAVNNALKHARATEIVIGLHSSGDVVQLEVIDNGIGMRSGGSSQGGMGMKILHHRAAKIGATLTIESENGHGTCIRCVWNRKIAGERTAGKNLESFDRR